MGGHGMAEALGASLGQAVGGMAAGAGGVNFLNTGLGGEPARGGGKQNKKNKKKKK